MRFEELLCALRQDYPDLVFKNGKKFMYRPPRTIYFEQPAGVGQAEHGLAQPSNDSSEQNLDQASGNQAMRDSLPNENNLQLLHEVGHAILQHRNYTTDPERLKMERAAWEQARWLCDRYDIYYDEDFIEAELDTYRDWLHQKSRCKRCGLTCYQLKTGIYRCPRCDDLLVGTGDF